MAPGIGATWGSRWTRPSWPRQPGWSSCETADPAAQANLIPCPIAASSVGVAMLQPDGYPGRII